MKYLAKSIYLLLAVLLLSSCEEMKQDMVFHKDGSGEMNFSMTMGGEMMEMMMNSFEGGGDSVDANEPSQKLIDESRDTVMAFYDLMPDSILNKMDDADLLKKWVMKMSMSEEDQSIKIGIDMPFRSIDELKEMFKTMAHADDGGAMGGAMSVDQVGGMIDTSFQWSPGHIHFGGSNLSDFPEYDEMMAEIGGPDNEETMAMIAMMFGDLSFDLTITAPGEIYRCDCPFGEVQGNNLVINYNIMDMFENLEEYTKPTDIYYKE